ncbi:MAG: DNA phosphorothioation-dependent restriction protein DptG [Lachnotalea sp.]
MEYIFSESEFKKNLKVKNKEDVSVDSAQLLHIPDKKFKLFPYKATGKPSSPIVYEMEEVISPFFKLILDVETDEIEYQKLCNTILDKMEASNEDKEAFKDIVRTFFFKDNEFVASNIGTYVYQSKAPNSSVERMAFFFFSILGLDDIDCKFVKDATNNYPYNALEKIVVDSVEKKVGADLKNEKRYFAVVKQVQRKFKNDFKFMLQSGMTSRDDFSNLLSLYYFEYMAQTCLELQNFCSGQRERTIPLYFALDWEKVSRNRKCCTEGWENLQSAVQQIFCHAIVLELMNQHDGEDMYDYIMIKDYIGVDEDKDLAVANEINKAAEAYISCIGDCKVIQNIPFQDKNLKTESAIIHLFQCVKTQFDNTERKRANQLYVEKFEGFCKDKWLKNRRKSGFVLNLTERNIIFLTKICLRDNDKMRLVDLFSEYEKRGVYLDSSSKGLLQQFFTKLNLIDKKSDSGDAQYVKRIL